MLSVNDLKSISASDIKPIAFCLFHFESNILNNPANNFKTVKIIFNVNKK